MGVVWKIAFTKYNFGLSHVLRGIMTNNSMKLTDVEMESVFLTAPGSLYKNPLGGISPKQGFPVIPGPSKLRAKSVLASS